ncbi:MAG TPA: type II secretion system secretin GspD [Candidatus Acidoferrales bacterium]|nr:type II secretion system secretin GspD [Candidatus Acidoferrales bacterium]
MTPFGPMMTCPPATGGQVQPAPAGPASNQPAGPAQSAPAAPANPSAPSAQPAQPEQARPAATPAGPQQQPAPAKPGAAQPAPQNPQPEQAKPGTPQPGQQPQQPGQAAPAAPAAVGAAQPGIALNLENADLYQVLRIIGSELGINYVVDPSVKGTVSINTSGSVSRADLFTLLETILQLNGAMMVKVGAYYRVMPLGDAKVAPVPLEFVKQPEVPPAPAGTPSTQPAGQALPAPPVPSGGLTLEVVPMRYVSAAEMGKILAPFVSPAGAVAALEQGNILLITETPAKLEQFRQIIDTFDSPEFARQRVRLFPVKNSLADNLIPELQNVFAGYALGSKTSAVQFVPLKRLNSILAISPSPEVFADVKKWIERLDQPIPESGVENYVYMVQNAKADDLRHILTVLYGGSEAQPQAPPPVESANPLVLPQAQAQAPQAPAPETSPHLQGGIMITADEKNNALIIQATPHDYAILEKTIEQLDILPRQVLINARIYQVNLTGDLSFGISAFLNQNAKLPGPLATSGSFSPGQTGGSLQATTFSIISQTRALELFLNATDNRSRVRMLSAPSILVTDNTTAKIQVGAEVPVPLGSALTPIQSGGTSIFAQTIQFQNTGVILTVTPRINASGIVSLNITQEVSSAVPNTTSAIVAPVINKTAFQTSVVLHDEEPLALGGMITTSDSLTRDRIPLLGDIPGLGMLFGSTTHQTARTELVLILTPHVIQDMAQANQTSSDFINQLRNLKQMIKKPD